MKVKKRLDVLLVEQGYAENRTKAQAIIMSGNVYVNGEVLNEPYINSPTTLSYDVKFPVTVPEGCVFLMGDNRGDSLDSRSSHIGFIDERYILGEVYMRIFPTGDWKIDDYE